MRRDARLPADRRGVGAVRTDPRGTLRTVVVLRQTARKAARSGVMWGYVFGIFVASSAISYTRIYKTPAERDAPGRRVRVEPRVSALFGPAPHLQTVAGFTVFKTSMTLMILGAVWGLLTSTRLCAARRTPAGGSYCSRADDPKGGATGQALGRPGRGRRHPVGDHGRDHRGRPGGRPRSASPRAGSVLRPSAWSRARSCSWLSAP